MVVCSKVVDPMKELKGWKARAPTIPWWTSTRSLRVATDCSGMCIPELALKMLCKDGRSMHTVFACDVMKSAQRWMEHLGLSPLLDDMNCRLWNKETGVMTAKTNDGKLFRLSAKDADLDLYVCGFMCTPFTPNGMRKAWQDEHAKTFWSTLKTITLLAPRAFVLENVMAISNNSNSEVVRSALSKLSRFVILHLKVNSIDFGVPHHRPRVYVVGLRKDVLRPCFSTRPTNVLETFFMKKLAAVGQRDENPNWNQWLKALGFPVTSHPCTDTDVECECSLGSCCTLHPCKCKACVEHGANTMKCLWRKNIKIFLKGGNVRKKRANYLKMWREVKKDNKLKKVPSYFDLARARKICTDNVTSPSRRMVLHTVSQFMNLNTEKAVLNVGKSIGRTQARVDGLVPTMGHGCTDLYFPNAGSYISTPQLLCLTGLHPEEHAREFQYAVASSSDMDILVGNAMCVPVVGSIMAVTLHMMKP